MAHLLIFGLGYTASYVANHVAHMGWTVSATGSKGTIAFDDEQAVEHALAQSTHILSTVPPVDGLDPVLARYGERIASAPAQWIGYLSSTGVYGDCQGAWVDESAPLQGRRGARNVADQQWQALRKQAFVFRLPGIYGPGRSILERLQEGKAHRIALPDQVFSRIHVEDIVRAISASFCSHHHGVYNIADDAPCSQNKVAEYGASLLGISPPPMLSLEEAALSPQALAFYAENRRVSNIKAKRLLGWKPAYSDFAAGLRALKATTNPANASTQPEAAVSVQ